MSNFEVTSSVSPQDKTKASLYIINCMLLCSVAIAGLHIIDLDYQAQIALDRSAVLTFKTTINIYVYYGFPTTSIMISIGLLYQCDLCMIVLG